MRSLIYRLAHDTLMITIAAVGIALAVVITLLKLSFVTVLSGSMGEALPVNSIAITMQVPTESVRPGDVVKLPLPDSGGAQYVHRVVTAEHGSQGMRFTTKGDANPTLDHWSLEIVSAETPKVVGFIPALGDLNDLTGQLGVRLAILVGVVAFLLLAAYRAMRAGFGATRRAAAEA